MSVARANGRSDERRIGGDGRASILPADLFFLEGDRRSALPEWGAFFVSAGSSLASLIETGYRYTIGVAVPIRAYAAAFAALGVVAARSAMPSKPENSGEYVAFLRGLPVDSAVSVRSGNRKLKGLYLGPRTDNGIELFGVQLEDRSSGGLSRWLPAAQAMSIEVANTPVKKLPKKQKGQIVASEREVIQQNSFAGQALSLGDVYGFVTYSRLECTIVGVASRLNEEITGTTLSVKSSDRGAFLDGTLQHLLRVREFSRPGQAYRCSVVSSGKKSEEPGQAQAPAVVVFDGATGFLKWRNDWENSNRLVVLDRTERHFEEAVTALNQEYVQNRADDRKVQFGRRVPCGVELMSFRENRR